MTKVKESPLKNIVDVIPLEAIFAHKDWTIEQVLDGVPFEQVKQEFTLEEILSELEPKEVLDQIGLDSISVYVKTTGMKVVSSDSLEIDYNLDLDGGLAKGQLQDALTNALKTKGFPKVLQMLESL